MRVRRLNDADLPEVGALLAADPVANCMLRWRIDAGGINRIGGDVLGAVSRGRIQAVAHVGGNVLPGAASDPAAMRLLGDYLGHLPRRSASIVGLAADVVPLWSQLAPQWGPARDERMDQPLMVADRPPSSPPDPRVRLAEPADAPALYPATVAMFTEEVGVSPLEASTEAAYRARLMWLIRQQRVYCSFDGDGVLFKAEVAAVTPEVCQVQGVWVRPDQRNRGVGSASMAAVVAAATRHSGLVSLYVNHYNTAALATYRNAGFSQVGTMASVHF